VRRPRVWLAAAAAGVMLAGCATDPGVATQSAERLVSTEISTPDPTAPPETLPPETSPPESPPPDTDPPATPPPTTTATTDPPIPAGTLGDRLDIGDAKPPRDYDEFVRLVLNDIELWWSAEYPAVYGGPIEALTGGVYAGYPERTAAIPGCESGQPTTYDEIILYSAFYCKEGDFMVYDDGPDGVLSQLATEFGPSILGVVFAHEYGHAVQARAGTLDLDLPTITTEQQADCFAGAWVAHARNGGAQGITFTDADVRSGLVAMITVRDPIGIDQFEVGGHGSAFDRVGAFQTGFAGGAARCAELVDDPLPLVPNVFRGTSVSDGNAEFGYASDEVLGFLPSDLQEYWNGALAELGAKMPTLTLTPIQTLDQLTCAAPAGSIATGAVYCPETQQVFLDEVLARDLYDRFGDFVIGYVAGAAWSEAAQIALDSQLAGEPRFLASDCLTGAWAATAIPGEDGSTARGPVIEPGDLDEAIQAALVVGDPAAADDQLGSGFERIASFRQGVLDGLDACTAQLGG